MPKLGISTWIWTSPFKTETQRLFPKIKQMGYDAVEIPVEYPEEIDGKEIRKALIDNDLVPIVCGAFGPGRDLTSEDKKDHENCFEYLKQCFDLCKEWGGGFVAGPMYSAVGKVRMLPADKRKEEWLRAVENLRKACELAYSHDARIALEPLNRFESDLVNTSTDVVRLVKDINHPSAGIMLDSFHMTIEEVNLEEAIIHAGSHLLHFQVSENHRGIPGTGLTDWNSIKRGLDRAGYEGVVSIESFTPAIKELAGAVCIWKTFADSQDEFAERGYRFLNSLFDT